MDDYEYAQMNGETIVYNPAGYRAVRVLLFALEDAEALEAVSVLGEEITELNPETNKDQIAKYRAEIDGFYAPAQARAEAALAELQAGADFTELLNTIGDELSKQVGVPYLFSDFKKREGYKRSCQLSAEYKLYRQDYCGCIFSKQESEARKNKDCHLGCNK